MKAKTSFLMMVLLTGCSVSPDYARPKLASPGQWYEAMNCGVIHQPVTSACGREAERTAELAANPTFMPNPTAIER